MFKLPEGVKNKNIILIEICGEDILYYDKYPEKLQKKLDDEKTRYAGWNAGLANKEITLQVVRIYDIETNRFSEKNIYLNNKGKYIKKSGKRYYLKDFK